MLNEELVKRLAMDDEKAKTIVNKLPISERISYSLASVDYIEKNGIETGSLSAYKKDKGIGVDMDGIGESMAKRLEEDSTKARIKEKQRQEYVEKLRQQQINQHKTY
ncbi:hypothetical protein [Priestia megaterium]|uniref:hypothetical protein n=1 Tax=Priestia megaterium TaxID=1404 RepID=UPI00372D1236